MKQTSLSDHPKQSRPLPTMASAKHDPAPQVNEIEMRAYYAYLNDGSMHGSDVANWLSAESGLRLERALPRSNSTRVSV